MKSINNINKLSSANDHMPYDDIDDLLSPSDKVWENVSKHLPIKKKKRSIFILFFAIAAATIYLFNINQKDYKSDVDILANEANKIKELTIEKDYSKKECEDLSIGVKKQQDYTELKKKPFQKRLVSVYPEEINQSNVGHQSTSSIVAKKSNANENVVQNSATNNLGKLKDENMFHQSLKISVTNGLENIQNSSVESATESHFIPNEKIELNSVKPLKMYLIELRNITIDSVIKKVNDVSQNFWLYGLSMSLSPSSYNSPQVNDPLEGTIKSSNYQNVAQINFDVNHGLSKHFFISYSPGVRYDLLSTSYDLNIPYDYNTELTFDDKKENFFSHSLPTDLGNIKTNMVVVRASDSPVLHNEKINIALDVNYKTISITNPLGIHYSFYSFTKGFHLGVRFVPQIVVIRNAVVKKYESSHTYVKEEHVDISKASNYKNLYFGADLQVGYRLPIFQKQIFLDINATYHKNLMNEGRPNDLDLGLSLLKSF